MKKINVAMVGGGFMGKTHSHAWKNAVHFFDLDVQPVMKVICDNNKKTAQQYADNWGWAEIETDWQTLTTRKDIDIIDICVPTYLHHEIAVAAARAGKHIFCEKPIALSAAQAQAMYEAAEASGIVHYLNHNYRRCPAVRLARQLIEEGKIGRIFHWRGAYLQDWIVNPDFPLVWQLQRQYAGAGPHFDLNSHSVDLARYLVGDISRVTAMTSNFITERSVAEAGGPTAFSAKTSRKSTGKVTVEDAAFMVVQFENGALGSFEASRFAPGRKNYNYFEIYGSKGSCAFNFERMNELQVFSRDDPANTQGFRTILATESVHPYMAAWWPPGHIIGYEHEFHHAVVDFLRAIATGGSIEPNFYDGMKAMQVLEGALESAETGKRVTLA
ncbi:MAG: Gfo/Idh/MocA family oxidoreductase [Phycisphaerae bacterium]|nr:Gfo/Idh/MocA family oxidoreductase [Phycisphaerae bacterium]